ncbi:uncharacterized protein PV09_05269 [Verruconis gallopava]|uniref:Enoyl reductase (ER) domain-containing protein n=1 Tax=Verruconis gallopava TaxID=253628 RepID=A0A0D1YSC6_9PEZI|nr:uncharacterized protein PV09_05269 [Verruconis gallopava]KIW03502.1 hypothetical protein PV09_05269 [Verruconis gallopava]
MALDYSTLKNKAIIYAEPGTTKTQVVELPVTAPGPGEVLVRLEYSGVCHTDYGFCTNAFKGNPIPTPQGQIGGHEGVGKIVALGPGVTSPPVGTVVGIKYAADACLNCSICLEGGETSCPSVRVSGFYTPGTFQQYCISWAKYVTPIPPEITDLAAAAPLMCAGITMYTALKRAGVKYNDWVLISGAGGGLGHLGIQYAKAMGARVLAIDSGSKEQFCKSLGAEAFLDFSKFDAAGLATQVHEVTGGGARIVLMCVSHQSAYDQAVGWLGFRGKVICLGVPEGDLKPIAGAVVGSMLMMEQSIMAIKTGNRLEAKESLDIVAAGRVKTHYQLRKMDELTQIFDDMHAGKFEGRAVIDLR